jgi:hypothetical protein
LKTVEGYRKKLPMPMTPLRDARMKAVRDGHWSRPSASFAGGGAIFAIIFLNVSMRTEGLIWVSEQSV